MTQVMKILRITPHFFREGKWPIEYDPTGGLQVQVWRLTQSIDEIGATQTVLTNHIPGSPRHWTRGQSISVECVGMTLSPLTARYLFGITWFMAVINHLMANHKAYDVIHIHYNHWIWCRLITLFAHRTRVPVTISLNTELWVSFKYRWLLCNKHFDLPRWIDRQMVENSDRVIALTQRAADSWLVPQRVRKRLVVIPDAIDAREFGSDVEICAVDAFCGRYGIPAKQPVVVYVGRLRHEKGWEDFPVLARVLSELGIFFLICGDGPDRRRLIDAMKSLECNDAWTVTGFLDPSEVRLALQIADVLVLPSRREAFGSVLLEAMAAGVPAVAYAIDGIIDVAGQPPAIQMVSPRQPQALVRAICKLLGDPQARNDLTARGHQRVQEFSLKTAAEQTMNCYRHLTDNSPATKTVNGPIP